MRNQPIGSNYMAKASMFAVGNCESSCQWLSCLGSLQDTVSELMAELSTRMMNQCTDRQVNNIIDEGGTSVKVKSFPANAQVLKPCNESRVTSIPLERWRHVRH